ncbi:MAG: response regulator [Chitinophagaceae bacterium]
MSAIKKILILDDDPEILELLSLILGNHYSLLTKINPDTLEKDLKEFQPHVILIDHFIGDKTSHDIIKKSLNNMHIPIILHSAHEEIEKISIQANVAGFIKKPSSIHEIRKCVARIVETT